MKSIVDLFHEIGMLAQTQRSGYAFVGTGKQSVAEHSHRMTLIAYALAKLSRDPIDLTKLLMICLLHDLPETRTGDLNNINKRYVKADETKVIEELKTQSPIGPDIAKYLQEYNDNTSVEAHLAHDADKLEMLLVLKELHDVGNPRCMEWFDRVSGRLESATAKELAKIIRDRPSDSWWKTEVN